MEVEENMKEKKDKFDEKMKKYKKDVEDLFQSLDEEVREKIHDQSKVGFYIKDISDYLISRQTEFTIESDYM